MEKEEEIKKKEIEEQKKNVKEEDPDAKDRRVKKEVAEAVGPL